MATKKPKWISGPPPHIGWWQASRYGGHNIWRWWNGEEWSVPVPPRTRSKIAAVRALSLAWGLGPPILWTQYWPEGARVPRIDPRLADIVADQIAKGFSPTGRIVPAFIPPYHKLPRIDHG